MKLLPPLADLGPRTPAEEPPKPWPNPHGRGLRVTLAIVAMGSSLSFALAPALGWTMAPHRAKNDEIPPVPLPVGSPILGQGRQGVEQAWGPYWSKLTLRRGGLDRSVIYTYSARGLSHVLPQGGKGVLEVEFVEGIAQSIKLHHQPWTLPPGQLQDSQNFPPLFWTIAATLGVTPPDPLAAPPWIYDDSGDGGTLHTTVFCVGTVPGVGGDRLGVALAYEWISDRDFVHYVQLSLSPHCSPAATPYNALGSQSR